MVVGNWPQIGIGISIELNSKKGDDPLRLKGTQKDAEGGVQAFRA